MIEPRWAAPPGVRAAFTLRGGGVSAAPWASLNLGSHVGDDATAVAENRARVRSRLALPAEPVWLEQVHGTDVADLDGSPPLRADASITRRAGVVCAVLVADCLPVLLATRDGSCLGVAHAGWRGLAGGVVEATVRAMAAAPRELVAWLGPCIGPENFEVGDDVRAAFTAKDAGATTAFAPNSRGRWLCDLQALARRRLAALGVASVDGDASCTVADRERFFSFRRDGQCGRMAALLWRPAPR